MSVERLEEMVSGASSPGEVIKILMDKGVISTTALRDLEVYYTYKEKEKNLPRMYAVYDTAIEKGVSDRTVYRARERFED